MRKNKFIKLTLLMLLIVISNILVFNYCNLEDTDISLSYNVKSHEEDSYQLFYGNDTAWKEEQSQTKVYTDIDKEKTLIYTIPKSVTELRFDIGSKVEEISIADIKLSYYGKNIGLDLNQLFDITNQNQIGKIQENNNYIDIETIGEDPYITYKLDPNMMNELIGNREKMNNIFKIFICIIIDMLMFVFLKKSKNIIDIIKEVKNNRSMIWNLAKNDFKTKYAGSYLGIIWAFIQPIVTILVYWFVFEVGLKSSSPMKGVPFILWLMAGLVPWFFFQEALVNATNCMMEYSYLVKKVVFNISILPIVKIISALFVHLVFIGFLFFVGSIYGFYPMQYTMQLIYYSFCTICLVLGISYATCAIVVFFKDLGQIINIFLQIGMWMTPIMWNSAMLQERFQWILKLNPMYYIIEGYRDSFINHVWFFERYFQTGYFWIITLALFVIGTTIFKKLKPHFADVL